MHPKNMDILYTDSKKRSATRLVTPKKTNSIKKQSKITKKHPKNIDKLLVNSHKIFTIRPAI